MKGFAGALAALILVGAMAAGAEAQVKERWKLDYKMEGKPRIYTHRNALDQLTNYWYFTYSVTNNTDQRVPMLIDLMLYVEVGKTMQHDVDKVSLIKTKDVFDKTIPYTRPYEKQLFGRFYNSTIYPEAEYDIIIEDLKLGNRLKDKELNDAVEGIIKGNRGIQEESILAFKKAYRYLNPREMRQKQYIQPGEMVHGLAIFTDVDPRANVVEVHVSGLYDIFRVIQQTDEDVVLAYENRVLREIYEFPGDAFFREKDVLLPPPKREWLIKKVGPIASRETVDALVQVMIDYLKFDLDARVNNMKPEEIEKARHDQGIFDFDIHVCARTFEQAMVLKFGYDVEKSPWENRRAIWKMHEFWLTNKSKLAFDTVKNQYVIKEDILPGKIDVKRDN